MGKAYWLAALASFFTIPQVFGIIAILDGNPSGLWISAVALLIYVIIGVPMMNQVAKVIEQPAWILISFHIGSNILPVVLPYLVLLAISISMSIKLKKSGVKMRYWTAWPKDIKARCEELDRENKYSNRQNPLI